MTVVVVVARLSSSVLVIPALSTTIAASSLRVATGTFPMRRIGGREGRAGRRRRRVKRSGAERDRVEVEPAQRMELIIKKTEVSRLMG